MRTIEVKRERKSISAAAAAPVLAFVEEHRSLAKDAGFPALGCPPGYFLDVPAVAAEASAFADKIRRRIAIKKDDLPDVQYSVYYIGGDLFTEVTYPV